MDRRPIFQAQVCILQYTPPDSDDALIVILIITKFHRSTSFTIFLLCFGFNLKVACCDSTAAAAAAAAAAA